MIQKEVKFKDGSRIYYKTEHGETRRVIRFAYTNEYIDNASKYFYLDALMNMRENGNEIFSEIQRIYDSTTKSYDLQLVKDFCNRIRNASYYMVGDEVLLTAIYLKMVDLEAEKFSDSWPGKKLVLDSCKAVLIDMMPPRKAAMLNIEPNEEMEEDDSPI